MKSPSATKVDRRSLTALASLCLLAIVFTSWLSQTQPSVFQKYFGSIQPLLFMIVCVVLASAILVYFQRRRWFYILQSGNFFTRFSAAFALATTFAIIVMAVDLNFPFPADINVSAPQSWLFYPVMAFVAETIFHLLPMAILLGVGSKLFAQQTSKLDSVELLERKAITISFFIFVASLEPIFQVVFASFEHPLSGLDIFTAVHVFAFGIVQLYLYRRYDFITMFTFRIIYYSFWHIIWGHLRIQI